MKIDPKASARRLRASVEGFPTVGADEDARRLLLSRTNDALRTLGVEPEQAPLGSLLALPLPTLHALSLILTAASDEEALAEGIREDALRTTSRDGSWLDLTLLSPARRVAAAGPPARILTFPSSLEWVIRSLAATIGVATYTGTAPENEARREAALIRLEPQSVHAAKEASRREQRMAKALTQVSADLSRGDTPVSTSYRGL